MIEVIDAKMDTSFLRDGYADFIKRWTHEEEGEFRDNRFHASGLGLCKRQQVARRAGFNGRPSTEDKESMFAEANFIHAGMTNFWLKTGTAIAREQRFLDLPLEMLTGEQVGTILHSPFPGWTGKFDALAHRPEWCGCGKASRDIAATWGEMVLRYNLQDPEWMIFRDELKKHLILPVSLKTVHPNGLRHYVNGPKLHNVWQDSWYVAAANKAYGLEWDRFIIMYRGRGGGGMPFFFIVKALDVEPLQADYEEAWRTYEEEHHMPPVLDLEAAIVEDKTWGEIVRLSTSWQCSYCDHADWTNNDGGFRCEPMCTKNKTSDRVAIIRDGTITAIQEWYEKSGYTMEYVHQCIEQMQDRENVRYKWDVKPTDRCFK